jgi:hypothetical protein
MRKCGATRRLIDAGFSSGRDARMNTFSADLSPPAPLWVVRVSAVVWFVLALGFLASLPVIFDWSAWAFVAVLVAAVLLAAPLAWLIRRLSRRVRGRPFARVWAKTGVVMLLVLGIVVAAPIYYLLIATEARPLVMPQATLSNGKKTVVVQGMLHVGTEGFYKAVVYDLQKALVDGYVLYYEGVQPSTPEAGAWFSKLLAGGHDLSDNYKELAHACGLQFQLDYFGLLVPDMKARPALHVAADVTTLEMKQEYERLLRTDPAFASAVRAKEAESAGPQPSTDPLTRFIAWQKKGNEGQKELAGIVCRGVATVAFSPRPGSEPALLDPVVLDFRNRALVQRIVTDTHDKIYITYGAAHLPGVISELQRIDPTWKVESLKWMRAISAPEHLQGVLGTKEST